MMHRWIAGLCVAAAALGAPHAPAQADEPRSRAWVEAYFDAPFPEGARTDAYLQYLNAHLPYGRTVDLDWLRDTFQAETRDWRYKLPAVGALAFAYRVPGSRRYQDPATLDTLRHAFRSVAEHVGADGRFLWETGFNAASYESQSQGHAWALEPLLFAYLWARDDLPADEAAATEAALHRAARWLYEHPKLENNNRGIAWAAVLMLAGHFFEEPAWVVLAAAHGPSIFDAIAYPDGEIGEHTEQYADGGPDVNYTYTSLAYLYAYRLWSGDRTLDARLEAAARWLAGYATLSQWPVVVGASVREGYANPDHLRDVLPFFERMAAQDPWYACLAERALARVQVSALPAISFDSKPHLVTPLFFALREANPAPGCSTPAPGWHRRRTDVYSRPQVHYALVSRAAYQTGLTLRARSGLRPDGRLYRRIPAEGFPLRGLQVWAWHDEPPLILHGFGGLDGRHSTACLGATCTASTDIARAGADWEVLRTTAPLPSGDSLAVLVDRRQAERGPSVWTLYAFTPAATVVAYGTDEPIDTMADDTLRVRWYMNRDHLAGHGLRPAIRRVSFADRDGHLHYLRGMARAASDHVAVDAGGGTNAFAFSDHRFRFEGFDATTGRLTFTDASGRYALDLRRMTNGAGALDRTALFRLGRLPAP